MKKIILDSKKIIDRIEEKSKDIKKYDVKKIGLFGSFAKNKQKHNSDIDFVVEFNKVSFDKYMDLKFLLEELFKRKIDLITEKGLKPEMNYIKEEAKYAKL